MTLRKMHWVGAGILILCYAPPAWSKIPSPEASAAICTRAAREASKRTGVPFNVLLALTLVETGRNVNGHLSPWPWALNQGGDSHWFPDADAALAYLSAAVTEGTTNIDVGCFQLNYRWHGSAFSSLESMMEPETNALYAARMVADLAGAEEDWTRAAGAFHSKTPDVAAVYLAKFSPILAKLEGQVQSFESEAKESRTNRFPLLQASGFKSVGSIVPIGPGGPSLIGAP